MLKKYYLGGFFWAPIPHKRYQNTSGLPMLILVFKEWFYSFPNWLFAIAPLY